jgi:3-oxoadipate enol-lactonase
MIPTNVSVEHGTLRTYRTGDAGGPLVVCVHGLSANARGFDPMARSLAEHGMNVVALDLRGRGESTTSAPGTYGWEQHARDVLAVAASFSDAPFHFVGHSMGAFIALTASAMAPSRLASMVLIDAAGFPEAAALPPILGAVERLGRRHASAAEYLASVRSLGTVEPWSEDWERYFRYELVEHDGYVESRTSRRAVMEDVAYASTVDPHALWPMIRCRSLLLRAARPLGQSGGFIVSAADAAAFAATVPGARSLDIDANHYGILMHPDTFVAIRSSLS